MRRITMWALSTVSALVLLFSYHTSTSSSAAGVVALGSINGVGPGAASGGATGTGTPTPTGTPSAKASPKASSKPTTRATPTPTATRSSSGGSTGSSSSSSSGSGTAGSASGSKSSSSAPSGTFTGASVMTQYGPVQVQITVSSGQITRAAVTQVPWNSPQDQQINSYAVPILNQEVVQAQSAQIDMVSGATFTSYGYVQSLQSAIDQAHL